MIINLMRYRREGDGSLSNPRQVQWDTDNELPCLSASTYGDVYAFVGVEQTDAPLSLTLMFQDRSRLAVFCELLSSLEVEDTGEFAKDAEQRNMWEAFVMLAEKVLRAAPKGYVEAVEERYPGGHTAIKDERYGTSYHADIDARRE